MKSKKTTTVEKAPEKVAPVERPAPTTAGKSTTPSQAGSIFDRENMWWMIGGAVLMMIGFLLMSGGRSEDPNVFNENEVYSTVRITIAPIFILAGLVIEIYAIFRTPKAH